MFMWPEILLQFLTIFLGAFLAFWLENLRERRQLKTGVKKYLKRGYKLMRQEILEDEKLLFLSSSNGNFLSVN
jgi:hypothetical protein